MKLLFFSLRFGGEIKKNKSIPHKKIIKISLFRFFFLTNINFPVNSI